MEQKFVPLLKEYGYYVIPNYSFIDLETGQSRELDIWAMAVQAITRRDFEFIFPILLIECKNLQAPLVFFTQKEIPIKELIGDIHLSGIPKEIERKGSIYGLSEFLKLPERWLGESDHLC